MCRKQYKILIHDEEFYRPLVTFLLTTKNFSDLSQYSHSLIRIDPALRHRHRHQESPFRIPRHRRRHQNSHFPALRHRRPARRTHKNGIRHPHPYAFSRNFTAKSSYFSAFSPQIEINCIPLQSIRGRNPEIKKAFAIISR